jgi:hypothetical protein
VGFIGPGCGWLKEAGELIHRVMGLGQVRQESVPSTLENSSPVSVQIGRVPSGQQVRGMSHNCMLLLALWCLASFFPQER